MKDTSEPCGYKALSDIRIYRVNVRWDKSRGVFRVKEAK